jgi:hypothetical protein
MKGESFTLLPRRREEGGCQVREFAAEVWMALRERKKFWLLPIIVLMLMFAGLLMMAPGSAIAPFVYTLF